MEQIEQKLLATPMAGVYLQDLGIVETLGGPVLHLLRSEYPLMPFKQSFGEIYFSEILPGSVKGWKRHKRQTQLFAVPLGLLKLVLFDERTNSQSKGLVQEFLLGRPKHYQLLKIPPMIWYAFTPANASKALLCNCADLPHDPTEAERLPLENARIPYSFT